MTNESTTKPTESLAATQTQLQADGKTLPEFKTELVSYDSADKKEKALITQHMTEINLSDSNSITFFGTKAQQQLTTISDSMLEGVRNKDIGAAGKSLSSMVSTIRGFDVDKLDPNRKPGFFARLFGKAKPVVEFLQGYEEVRKQIDGISIEMERHKTQLLTDITSLDHLYQANLQYYHDLELYIAAGDEKLKQLDQQTIPALEQTAAQSEDMLKAQELRDLRSVRNDLERRVHDLRLTRQVAMQSLPSIRLVQENDKGLVSKINSTLVNTVPLWRQQLAQAVTVYRSGQAAETVKEATDLTNELLQSNAENLRTANAEVRTQLERGIFDIEVIKKANQSLIETIQDSLRIADEGKRARANAEQQLETLETELRGALSAASSQANQPTPTNTASQG